MTYRASPVLTLTCGCGARLAYHNDYDPYVLREREAFNAAHEGCRTRVVVLPPA